MNTKRFTFFFVFLLFLVQGIWAQHVSPEQAKEIASKFLKVQSTKQGGRRNAPSANMLKTAVVFNAKDMAGQPYLYAVSATLQDGFVLVSGDERFKAVLGYSDVSNFDEQNMPDNMRVFLQGYIDEMRYLDSIGYQPSASAPSRTIAASPKTDKGPLMTTTWNQGAPYNNQCPTDPSTNQTSVTGCVATAMAQVVAYHIKKGDGPTSLIADIPGYTTATHHISVPIITDRNLPNSSLLQNSYANGAGSLDEKAAVAKLMFYCGASVYMDYASSSSGSNGAYAPNALINYFGFDSTTRLVSRSKYTYAEWIDLMYDELAAQRPVFYGGQSAGGGHAFVLDGFRASDSFFHVNWGWGGSNDGYFALSVLNPYDTSQIGASSTNDGFAMYQDAVIGVQIGSGQTYTEPIYLDMTGFRVEGQTVNFNAFSIINDNNKHIFDIGVELINANGEIIETYSLMTTGELSYLSGYNNLQYPVGNYQTYAGQTIKIVPVSRENGTTTWYPSTNPNIDYFTATYDANGVPTLAVHPSYSLSGTISVPSNKYVSYTQDVNVSITNNGDEFYGPIYLFASTDANNKGAAVTRLGLTSLTNTTETSTFEWTPTATGNYTLWVTRDEQGNEVIATGSVTITEDLGILIANKTDWDNFCAAVNNGNNYYGKTVRLTSDIGTAQDPVTTMAGTIENSSVRLFMGTFIGDGYTLTVNYNTTAEVTAPFRYVYNAVIRDLHVAGTITTNQEFASGLVGDIYGGTSVTIQNCRSSVTINSAKSGYGTHGGFIGKVNTNATANITGCLFDGSFTTTNATQHCGGFIGYTYSSAENIHISNSVMKPSSVASGMLDNTFVRYSSGTPDITNCYYIPVTNLPTDQGKEAHTISGNSDIASLAISGTATEYNVSGITAYEGSNGLKYGSTVYAGSGDVVNLALTANPPAHYSVDAYTASAGSITTNSATSATLTMPNEDVTVGATWQPDELDTDDSGAYVINTKDDWNRFCLRVNNGLSTYSGKTVKLTGNIGTAQNPVTTMAGAYYYDDVNSVWVENRFQGTFDGGGYTLTIGYGSSNDRFSEQFAAPFRHVKGATIQNLHVAGDIYIHQQCAAGIVGQVKESPVTLTNCRSSVNINSDIDYSGQHAGFVAYIWPELNGNSITGCLFDGSLTTTSTTTNCGTFFAVAGGTTTVTNCVVKPGSVSAGMLSNTFGYGSVTFTNCYYIPVTNLPTDQGKEAHTISAGANVTSLAISTTPTTTYNVSGITLYGDNKGLMIGDVVYAAENDEVDLTLAAPSQPGATVGFVASAGTLDQTDATHATLTMPNEDVTISADYLVNTNYIAADGTSQSQPAKELTSSDHELTSGWYVVNSDVTINPYLDCNNNSTRRINVSGDVKLILADGATLDVTHIETPSVSGGIHVPAGSSLTIYRQSGGTGVLNASTNSSDEAAIGGGYPGLGWGNAHAGTITIYGGTINAIAYDSGIGGTHGSHGGTVNIHGGLVTAQGGMGAAIGGGESCTGFTVNIFGGTVNATGGTEAAAIGGGGSGSGGTVNISGGVINATANYSTYLNNYEGYGIGGGTGSTSLTTVNLSWTNATDHITATSYNGTVNLLKAFTATDGSSWLQGNGIETKPDGKTLYPANTLLFLANNADNSADISAAKGNTRNVVLSDRTLYKDGKWNTLCLPFNVTLAGSPLEGADVRTLSSASLTDGTLTLNFTAKDAVTELVAGTPYIIKWTADANYVDDDAHNLVAPVFSGVTISNTTSNVSTDYVDFKGTYDPLTFNAADRSVLFMGGENTLYYPQSGASIGAQRAYFRLKGIEAGDPVANSVKEFVLNFGEDTETGIINYQLSIINSSEAGAWYSLDGRKLSDKPSRAGVYINNGRKVVIK